jgi:uncharacterized membrane protein
MFEYLFKYPVTVFSKGKLVLGSGWPVWLLAGAILIASAVLFWLVWKRRFATGALARSLVIWTLQSALVAVLLLMLWQPALSISTLKPQQNIVAVVVDDSKSMGQQESGGTRRDQAVRTLNSGLLDSLRKRFQVRLYRLGDTLQRIGKPDELNASAPATRIADGLKQVIDESASLPVGAVVLLSDGAENAGGIDLETVSEIRRHQVPVHTIGFGREKFAHDVEVTDFRLPQKTLADSRVMAQISFRQTGYAGQRARVTIRSAGKTLASEDLPLKADGIEQTVPLLFSAGPAGAKDLEARVEPLQGEENVRNNGLARVLQVDGAKPRILYIEGEPRWEFKFIRRAIDEDHSLKLVSILRTTQNKIYRQGIDSPDDLKDGFPTKVEDLFAYDSIIIGSVEANWFTGSQAALIKDFVDRRGGGVLFLGGRFGLADGGYSVVPFNDLLPVTLPSSHGTYHAQTAATAELTQAGRDSLVCRIEDNIDANAARWKKLPYLMNYQDAGTPKPGALVLADVITPSKSRVPLLITQNYGRGRTAVFATGGSWRWQMQSVLGDRSHDMFWQQLLRWLVTGTPGHVVVGTDKALLADDGRVHVRAEVRDTSYLPAADAQVEAHILGPDNLSEQVAMRPDPQEPGVYVADLNVAKQGAYLTEVVARRGSTEVGRDAVTFRRDDGIAESFHLEQNRELLEKLSAQTGGRYYKPGDTGRLGDDITYSEAGITVRETRDLWNMPILFFLLLILRGSEWLLRRKWGVI